MADLIAIRFQDQSRAEEALKKAGEAQKQHLVDLADAVIVSKDTDGRVTLKQSFNTVAAGATTGGMWGTLIGLVFLNPLLGLAVGAASGALSGYLTDFGINDDMMKRMGQELPDGSSALFVLVRKATPDRVLPELRELGGEVFHTSLSREQEDRLREALSGEAERRMSRGEPLVDGVRDDTPNAA
ncbi:DUF1269 domain-containing protein [Jannaschia ovalis]|uniref:DUF1269 domain-containing protein n=1 Tax=Jannaschia ovalis TaxID=3038773 RepID=A0ABY8LC25_9RHOB|nr:DUF1269 domain-containing protein [Jannaschia sp. GRR-S6-38]WGH78878.1 DUF1269 domain-containing protein [Jannaschia sp. GRR-S6-38]